MISIRIILFALMVTTCNAQNNFNATEEVDDEDELGCKPSQLEQFSIEYQRCTEAAFAEIEASFDDAIAGNPQKINGHETCGAFDMLIGECSKVLKWCFQSSQIQELIVKQKQILKSSVEAAFPQFEWQHCWNPPTTTTNAAAVTEDVVQSTEAPSSTTTKVNSTADFNATSIKEDQEELATTPRASVTSAKSQISTTTTTTTTKTTTTTTTTESTTSVIEPSSTIGSEDVIEVFEDLSDTTTTTANGVVDIVVEVIEESNDTVVNSHDAKNNASENEIHEHDHTAESNHHHDHNHHDHHHHNHQHHPHPKPIKSTSTPTPSVGRKGDDRPPLFSWNDAQMLRSSRNSLILHTQSFFFVMVVFGRLIS